MLEYLRVISNKMTLENQPILEQLGNQPMIGSATNLSKGNWGTVFSLIAKTGREYHFLTLQHDIQVTCLVKRDG